MNTSISGRWLLALFVLIATVGYAAPVPVLDIAKLVERADIVVMGRIVHVADAGPAYIDMANGQVQARSMLGEVLVDHIFKGAPAERSLRFQFAQPDVPMGYRGVASGAYRVLFLTGSDTPYRFASPYHPSVIAAPDATVSADQTVDQVFEAVGWVLRARGSSTMDKREAISALWGVKSASARGALQFALSERDPTLQLNAAAALLAANDVSALPMATEALLQARQSLPPEVLPNLRAAISRGLTAEAAIPALARLLQANDPGTRRAAALALGRTNSEAAMAHLGRALEDPDFEVRLAAARGLAEVTGQREHIMSADAFRADEQRFVTYWKHWMARR